MKSGNDSNAEACSDLSQRRPDVVFKSTRGDSRMASWIALRIAASVFPGLMYWRERSMRHYQ